MAILITEQWMPVQSQLTDKGWTAVRAFDVTGVTTEMDAIGAIQNPANNADGPGAGIDINSPHPRNGILVVGAIDAKKNGLNAWVVTITYAIPPSGNFQTFKATATDKKPTIRWRIGNTSEQIDCDIYGNAITNSARKKFSSNPSRNFISIFCTITRNELFFDLARANTYSNKVNNNTFTFNGMTFSPGWVYLASISPAAEYNPGAPYLSIAYEFEIRLPISNQLSAKAQRNPFQLRILDAGFQGKNSAGEGNFTNAKGEVLTEETLLNGSGAPLVSGIQVGTLAAVAYGALAAKVIVDAGSGATWLIYMRYDEVDFMALNL